MPKTILIATSDPHITYLLQRYAEESGFKPVRSSAALVWELAKTDRPALIVLEPEALLVVEPTALAQSHTPLLVYTCGEMTAKHSLPATAGYLHQSVMYDDFVAALEHLGVRP